MTSSQPGVVSGFYFLTYLFLKFCYALGKCTLQLLFFNQNATFQQLCVIIIQTTVQYLQTAGYRKEVSTVLNNDIH